MVILVVSILAIGSGFEVIAEEFEKSEDFIKTDFEKASVPEGSNEYQEITISGHTENYTRGNPIMILLKTPDGNEEKFSTYATKKGEIHMILHFTKNSQIGVYNIMMIYNNMERAATIFELLETK